MAGRANHRSGNPAGKRTNPGSQSAAPRAIFLVGFMGAGKTSVGRALSRRLGWPFEDLDDRIQAREGRSIEQIFQQRGEAEFRRAEHAALQELLQELGSGLRVVALGGGAFVQPDNAAMLGAAGAAVIFLDAPVKELFRRCRQDSVARPLGRDLEQFIRLYDARRPRYMAAGLRVETGGRDVETVAAEVACSLGLR